MAEKSPTEPKRLMIVDSARQDHGKTTALTILGDELGKYVDANFKHQYKTGGDVIWIVKWRDTVIGLSSGGDELKSVNEGFDYICNHMESNRDTFTPHIPTKTVDGCSVPDIFITAAHPTPKFEKTLSKLAELYGYDRRYMPNDYLPDNEELRSEANQEFSDRVIKVINGFVDKLP